LRVRDVTVDGGTAGQHGNAQRSDQIERLHELLLFPRLSARM
jgi:hypothetical protein